jgi:ferredoxin
MMVKRRMVLDFPKALIEQPVTSRLIREYDLEVNILRATVTMEEGRLVVEVSGKRDCVEKGIDYLRKIGIKLTPLAQDIEFQETRCTHCTYCVGLCPTGAFKVVGTKVEFDKNRCILCEECMKICPYGAVEIRF